MLIVKLKTKQDKNYWNNTNVIFNPLVKSYLKINDVITYYTNQSIYHQRNINMVEPYWRNFLVFVSKFERWTWSKIMRICFYVKYKLLSLYNFMLKLFIQCLKIEHFKVTDDDIKIHEHANINSIEKEKIKLCYFATHLGTGASQLPSLPQVKIGFPSNRKSWWIEMLQFMLCGDFRYFKALMICINTWAVLRYYFLTKNENWKKCQNLSKHIK